MVHSSWIVPPVIFVAIKFLLLPVLRIKIAAGFIFAISGTVGTLACLIVAVIALWSAWRKRNRKILIPAVIGLIVSTLFTIAAVGGWAGAVRSYQNRVRARVTSQAAKTSSSNPATVGRTAFENEGWFGTIRTADTVIGLAEMADNSSYAALLRNCFKNDFSAALITIDNNGTDPVSMDPDSFRFQFPNDRELRSLPMNDFLRTAKDSPDRWIARTGSPWNISPGEVKDNIFIPLPSGTRLREAKSISVLINGNRFVFEGQLYTAAEKQDLVKRGKEVLKAEKE